MLYNIEDRTATNTKNNIDLLNHQFFLILSKADLSNIETVLYSKLIELKLITKAEIKKAI